MTPGQILGAILLAMVVSAAGGVWMAARHYRPLLDIANTDLANAKSARDNLEALAGEQGRKLGELVLAASEREQYAAQAQADARDLAKTDYVAAIRLLQDRTGGDQCAAAEAIIDQELGL